MTTKLGSPALQIVFKDLRYTVQVKKRKEGLTQRDILLDCSGVLEPARCTAVMGASGAGKTTLLNTLAGYAKSTDRVSGSISVNGEAVTGERMRRISGFVHQEDVILHTMTVREALVFSAMLKLPGSMPASEKASRALHVAALLNLGGALDSVVGSAMIKGISGGEKRRLSLGMEMVTEPAILFLDEPSSGLDSFNAYKVVHILQSVAHNHNRTVVCTIHQPSSEVFHMFDDLLVLAAGQMVYLGSTGGMVDYFAGLGYRCPTYTNPADYLFMEILNAPLLRGDGDGAGDGSGKGSGSESRSSGEDANAKAAAPAHPGAGTAGGALASVQAPGGPAGGAAEEARIAGLISAWRDSEQNAELQRTLATGDGLLASGLSAAAALPAAAPLGLQLRLLAARAGRNAWRNPLILRGKLAQTVFLALVVGLIYLHVGDDLTGVQDRQGSLFFIVVNTVFGSVMGILTIFGAEKTVFSREYGNRMYGLPSYFVSRWGVELPGQVAMPVLTSLIVYWMVGYQDRPDRFGWFALTLVLLDACGSALGILVASCFNDLSVALSVMPMFLLPLMVFSGFFVNSNTIPPYFVWIQYISPMRYGFLALAKNEFAGLQIRCTPAQDCAPGYSGDTVLRNMGFDDKGSVEQNAGILFAMVWGLLAAAYGALWLAVRRLTR